MFTRRALLIIAFTSTAALCFTLGVFHARSTDARDRATYDAKLDAIRAEVRGALGTRPEAVPAGTIGRSDARSNDGETSGAAARARMVTQIKQELQKEMGLTPVKLMRDRGSSFVELYATDNVGKTNYGTAGYLGHGYFVTVKHGVVALKGDDERQTSRRIVSIKISYGGEKNSAEGVDKIGRGHGWTPVTSLSRIAASSLKKK